MSEHKIEYGRAIIEKLLMLGEALGYFCEKEYPIDNDNKSAVDVAWLSEKGQKYPLFIFEVESATTNSIFANPSKIFGQPNQIFEKPLFLFHLLLKGGADSAKIKQLENLFGAHNYRIYRFGQDEEAGLITDVLSQHRRLTNSLDIIAVMSEIIEKWELVDLDTLVRHIENLEFEKNSGSILPAYAYLSKKYEIFKPYFINRLKNQFESQELLINDNYQSYFGDQWPVPIYLGLLSAFADDSQNMRYFNALKYWQEKTFHLKQIGAYFGRSRDYDLFILGLSGGVLGLTATLFYKSIYAREYLAGELFDIIKKTEKLDTEAIVYNAIWLMHIVPNTEKGKAFFDYTRNLVNSRGGIPELLYLNPPINFMHVVDGEETIESFGKSIAIPTWEDFRKENNGISPNPETIFELALNYLLDNDYNWNPITANQL